MAESKKTRRWDRMPVDLPVRVVTSKGFSTTVVEGRGTEMSEGGMTLYAGILLNPGDLLEVEFDFPTASRVPAIVAFEERFLLRSGVHHSAAVLNLFPSTCKVALGRD